jgi:hypothetical protein
MGVVDHAALHRLWLAMMGDQVNPPSLEWKTELRAQFTIETISAAKNACQKPVTGPNGGTRLSTNQKSRVFTIRMKNPSVTMMKGRLRSISTGPDKGIHKPEQECDHEEPSHARVVNSRNPRGESDSECRAQQRMMKGFIG